MQPVYIIDVYNYFANYFNKLYIRTFSNVAITFPYKTEKYRAFPGQPHSKTEIFRKNYEFSTLNGQKGEKIPF